MINNIINTIINTCSTYLSENQDKIKEAAKKRAKEEAIAAANKKAQEEGITLQYPPSPNDFKNQLKALQIVNQSDLLKVEKVYNKFLSLVNKAIFKAENAKNELIKIRERLDKIKSLLEIINIEKEPISLIIPLVSIIKNTLTAPGGSIDQALTLSSSPVANGLLIDKLGDKKKELKEETKKFEDSIKSIPSIITFFNDQIEKIYQPVNKGILGLEKNIQILRALLDQIILIYQEFIASLILPQLNDEDNDNETLGNTNLSDYMTDEDNLSTLLSDILSGGKPSNTTLAASSDDSLDESLEETLTSLVFKRFKQ
tara:strand:- start:326 stop:1267 length:942 start_codon:yes stop_codon:yes gene_type:complete